MTEEEWQASGDPTRLLNVLLLTDVASERKMRLAACGCCRAIFGNMLPNEECHMVIDVAEQFADGLANAAACQQASEAALAAPPRLTRDSKYLLPRQIAVNMANTTWSARELALCVTGEVSYVGDRRLHPGERRCKYTKNRLRLAGLIRDVFGNPLRPTTLAPAWQTANVVAIAQAIYAERAFERLPILADALEEAGCTDESVLQHCRQPGEHVRGCWVVDRVLGRE